MTCGFVSPICASSENPGAHGPAATENDGGEGCAAHATSQARSQKRPAAEDTGEELDIDEGVGIPMESGVVTFDTAGCSAVGVRAGPEVRPPSAGTTAITATTTATPTTETAWVSARGQ